MAIDRDVMRRRDVTVDPQQREMPRRYSVPPQQIPKGVPMPDRRFDFRRDMPLPMPMPSPDRRFDFRRDMPMPTPMPSPMPPPGMGPFRQQPFPDMMPRNIGRLPMSGETGRSLGPAGGPLPAPTGRSLRDIFEGFGPDKFQDYLDKGLGSLPEMGMEAIPMPIPMPMPDPAPMQPMPIPMPMPDPAPMQPVVAKIDPSDYRTIIKMIEQGLDPDDYMNRGGIASLLQ